MFYIGTIHVLYPISQALDFETVGLCKIHSGLTDVAMVLL